MSNVNIELLAEHAASINKLHKFHDRDVTTHLNGLAHTVAKAKKASSEDERNSIIIYNLYPIAFQLMMSAIKTDALSKAQFDPNAWAMSNENRKTIKKNISRYKR